MAWPVECTAKFSETPLDMAYCLSIQFTGSSFGGHSCRQHPNCALPQNFYVIVLPDETAHFRVAFSCGQRKAHLSSICIFVQCI